MKLLTAATGDGPDDFSFTVDGELLYLGPICDRDRAGGNGCGCARAFVGVASGYATTRAVVREIGIDRAQLRAVLVDKFTAAGWSDPNGLAAEIAVEMVEMGREHPVGTELRRSMWDIHVA